MSSDIQTDGASIVKKHKVLLSAVIIMGVLLVAGFVLVVATIAMRASQPLNIGTVSDAGDASGAGGEIISLLPAGSKVKSMKFDGGRLAVHAAPDAGGPGVIIIYDVRKGRELSRIKLRDK